MAKSTPLSKRILRHPAFLFVACWIVAQIIRLIQATNRVSHHAPDSILPYMNGEKNAIFAFWHGRLLMQPLIAPPRDMYVLVSHHNDGALIAQTVEHLGIRAVRGSSSKGARRALSEMVGLLRKGYNIGITPDGPRGPFQEAAPGAVQLAKISGIPIIPVSFSASRHKRLRSWDKFMVPKPFGRICYHYAEPISVGGDAKKEDIAMAQQHLQEELNRITAAADKAAGVTPVAQS